MKELLMQIDEMEQELNKVQEQAEYWLVEEHYVASITSERVDEKTARVMFRTKRTELEKLFV